MLSKHAGKLLAPVVLVWLTGCASTGGMNGNVGDLFTATADNPIRIESEPSGASVYVMDKLVGSTPVSLSNRDVFPAVYPKNKESLYGKVTLRQAGCADLTRTVDSNTVNFGLHAQLDCGGARPASPKAAGAGQGSEPRNTSAPPRLDETPEQRLEQIKQLLDKGLITEDEAKQARARILKDL